MIKKLILSIIISSALLQADNIFSKLPYGIKLGENIPKKIFKMDVKSSPNYITVKGKFSIKRIENTYKVIHILYSGGKDKFPKVLRKAGLWLCSYDYHGTPYEDTLQIIKKNNVSDLENNKVKGNISFNVDNMHYTFSFFKDNEYGDCKVGGISMVSIRKIEEDEY